MNIAAMSTMMSQAKVQQQASISVMKMAMNSEQNTAKMLTNMMASTKSMEQSVNPHIGGNVDIKL